MNKTHRELQGSKTEKLNDMQSQIFKEYNRNELFQGAYSLKHFFAGYLFVEVRWTIQEGYRKALVVTKKKMRTFTVYVEANTWMSKTET